MSHRPPADSSVITRVLVVLVAAVALGACGSSPAAPPLPTGPDQVTQEPVAPVGAGTTPATDVAPLLELVDVCYGECGPLPAGDLPTVAVYPDGTIVRHGFVTASGQAQGRLAGYDGRIGSADLTRLVAEARAADLDQGGAGVNGTTHGIADGGGTRLVARIDGVETVIEAPMLGHDPDPVTDGDPAQRAALGILSADLRGLGSAVAAHPRKGERWAVLAVPADATGGTVTGVGSWPGPDPAGFEAPDGLTPDQGRGAAAVPPAQRCGVDPGSSAVDLLATSSSPVLVRVGTTAWLLSGRPLLPHEHSCADVAVSVRAQRDAELAGLRAG